MGPWASCAALLPLLLLIALWLRRATRGGAGSLALLPAIAGGLLAVGGGLPDPLAVALSPIYALTAIWLLLDVLTQGSRWRTVGGILGLHLLLALLGSLPGLSTHWVEQAVGLALANTFCAAVLLLGAWWSRRRPQPGWLALFSLCAIQLLALVGFSVAATIALVSRALGGMELLFAATGVALMSVLLTCLIWLLYIGPFVLLAALSRFHRARLEAFLRHFDRPAPTP